MFGDGSVRFSKSKEKCYTCRRQRIVCDAGKPSCMRCTSRGVECLGYSATPIRWVAPTSTLSSEAPRPSDISHVKGQERRKRGRPKLFLMQGAPQSSRFGSDPPRSGEDLESEKGTQSGSTSRTAAVLASTNLITAVCWQACSSLARDQIQRFLGHFFLNDHICPELVIVDSPLNPHRMDLDILPYVPDFLLSLVISVSAIHQVIQSQPNWHLITLNRSRALRNKVHPGELEPLQSFHHPLNSLIYKHRSRSLRGLNQYLSEAGAEGPDLVFHTVTAMLMSEVCNVSVFSKSASDMRIHSDGLEKGFPCPDELLACIIHTNNLRFILHHHPYDDMAHVNSAILDLVRNIITFAPTAWAERALESYNERLEERVDMQRPRERLDLVPQPVEGEGWADLASTFQAATLLYCLRALVLNHGKENVLQELLDSLYEGLIPDVQCLASVTLSNLLYMLHPLMDQPLQKGRSMGRFMFWPVLMAGLESTCSFEALSERPFIVRSLQELCRCLGDMSALDAAVFLQSAWSIDEESHSGNMQRVRTWDELFEGVGVHGVFFF
ncbi:Zn(II)2Cys6 transcription factor [Aspergillus fischeri NRRL 181]|uniref:C6 transcription factor, putative n=1 Tax=Neosartorya fischeri (strain ATCC 1020 / DSM 3700 / CBS 544.65 / FGSC A1164 / JCM 1740 / NRRL 181 / WB 181) TaxID=331117 RepID=A1D117_NEOFI|nr:C6 transcription factor, putative [Aspergillus fischeri NRRL 181]EAW22110.1 C6 transcription factor, putative [Aspergillus fischeri NRRL 181]